MDIKLDAYEGPLDLLLNLIRKNEIDIYDIPISILTAQYLEAMALLPPDMEGMSEFLVMAATLLEIKSRMLLPRPKKDDDDDGIDPREALVQKLLAYQHAQALAEELARRTPPGERLISNGDRPLLAELRKDSIHPMHEYTQLIGIEDLTAVLLDLLSRRAHKRDKVRADYGEMPRERFTIPEKVAHITQVLQANGRAMLSTLFDDCQNKSEMIVTFLAVLEMVRRQQIIAMQSSTFADVEVMFCA